MDYHRTVEAIRLTTPDTSVTVNISAFDQFGRPVAAGSAFGQSVTQNTNQTLVSKLSGASLPLEVTRVLIQPEGGDLVWTSDGTDPTTQGQSLSEGLHLDLFSSPRSRRYRQLVPTVSSGIDLTPLLTDLEVYFPMNEAAGDAIDYGRQAGNWATATNTPGQTSSGLPSGLTSARTFTRTSSERFEVPYHTSLAAARGNVNQTYAVWWKLGSLANDQSIMSVSTNTGDREWHLFFENGTTTLDLYWFAGGGFKFLSDTSLGTVSVDTWYLTFFGWDADSGQSFIQTNDLAEARLAVTADNPSNGTTTFSMGARNVAGWIDHVEGEIGPVACWSTVLSEELRSLYYANGTGVYIPTPVKVYAPNTVTYFFDSSNIDGSDNSTLTDGDLIDTWVNLGSGGNATQANDAEKPMYRSSCLNGRDAVSFGGDGRSSPANPGDHLVVANSATEWNYVQNTGDFQTITVTRSDLDVQHIFLGSAFSSTQKGMAIINRSDRTFRVFLTDGTTTVVTKTSAFTRDLATLQRFSVKGDGVNMTFSDDIETYEANTAFGAFATGTGDEVLIGACSAPSPDERDAADGLAGLILSNPAQFTSDQEAKVKASIDAYFGFAQPQVDTSVICLGDSITFTAPSRANVDYPLQLEQLLGRGYATANLGKGGDETTDLVTAYTSFIDGRGADWLVYLGGVNDIINTADSAATIFGQIETVVDDALTDGMMVMLLTVLPFKNYSGWTSGMQTRLLDLNTLILAKSDSNLTLVDAYDAFNDPLDDGAMLGAYDVGDGLHPGEAGTTALAQLVSDAIS